jgi:hypothetical protein
MIKINKKSAAHLLMQRSELRSTLLRPIDNFVRFVFGDKIRRSFLIKILFPIEKIFRWHKIESQYEKSMRDIYYTMSNYLPKKATRSLDIGAGFGGINFFIYKHYEENIDIWLLDKDGMSDTWSVGMHDTVDDFSFYNNFDHSTTSLRESGVDEKNIYTVNIEKDNFPVNHKFDLIISLLSYGFHYPVSTYLNEVQQSLSVNGVLILDLRSGTYNIKEIEDSLLMESQSIFEGNGYTRFAFKRKLEL